MRRWKIRAIHIFVGSVISKESGLLFLAASTPKIPRMRAKASGMDEGNYQQQYFYVPLVLG
jgi:hypothetical protein